MFCLLYVYCSPSLQQDKTLLLGVFGFTAARIKEFSSGRYEFNNVFNIGTITFDEKFGNSARHVIGPTIGAGFEFKFFKRVFIRIVYLFTYFTASQGSSSGTVNNGQVPSNGEAGDTGVFFASSGATGGERILNHEILFTAIINFN